MGKAGTLPTIPDTTVQSSSWISVLYIPVAAGIYTLVLFNYVRVLLVSGKDRMTTKPFYFNAATISVLATAAKVPSDLTGTPTGVVDHLLRLTAVLLYCLTITLSLSAVGFIKGRSTLLNLMGFAVYLGIEVFNLFAHPARLATPFRAEQMLLAAVMLSLCAILLSHSLTVSVTRRRIERKIQYRLVAYKLDASKHPGFNFSELQKIHEKYWVMAVTSNPNWALRAWGTPLVCASLTWGVAGTVLVQRVVRVLLAKEGHLSLHFRTGNEMLAASLLLLHLTSILLGFAATILQDLLFNPVPSLIKKIKKRKKEARALSMKTILDVLLNVEDYRLEMLHGWRRAPLPYSKILKKAVTFLRSAVVDSLKLVHIFIIWGSNLVLMAWAIVVSVPSYLTGRHDESHDDNSGTSAENTQLMDHYDMRLLRAKYEDMVGQNLLAFPTRWIQSGRSSKFTHLRGFLKEDYGLTDYGNLYKVKKEQLIKFEYPPHCWTLTILVLATIIDLNFRESNEEVKKAVRNMKKVVVDVLPLAKMVDLNLGPSVKQDGQNREQNEKQVSRKLIPPEEDTIMMRKAVDMVLEDLDLNLESSLLGDVIANVLVILDDDELDVGDIFHVNSYVHASILEQGEERREQEKDLITRRIEHRARAKVVRIQEESVSDRSPDLFYYNCFYRVAASINEHRRMGHYTISSGSAGGEQMDIKFLKMFENTLANVILACLWNLPHALILHCSGGEIGEKEERVRAAMLTLGKTEDILQIISKKKVMHDLEKHWYPQYPYQ